MDPNQIANMVAGHALDRLVAERVMGWREGAQFHMLAGSVQRSNPLAGSFEDCTWSPSTDIAAAWDVVDRMKETNIFRIENDQGEILEWHVDVECIGAVWAEFSASADTAPLAICHAALLAMTPR